MSVKAVLPNTVDGNITQDVVCADYNSESPGLRLTKECALLVSATRAKDIRAFAASTAEVPFGGHPPAHRYAE